MYQITGNECIIASPNGVPEGLGDLIETAVVNIHAPNLILEMYFLLMWLCR
jgi:hypothetical protein